MLQARPFGGPQGDNWHVNLKTALLADDDLQAIADNRGVLRLLIDVLDRVGPRGRQIEQVAEKTVRRLLGLAAN